MQLFISWMNSEISPCSVDSLSGAYFNLYRKFSIFKTYGKISEEIKLGKLKMISKGTGIPLETVCNYNYLQLYKMYVLLKEAHEQEMYEFKGENRIKYDHGYHVLQKLITEDGIENFVKLWRKHFMDAVQPKYMPTGWSVDFRIKTNI